MREMLKETIARHMALPRDATSDGSAIKSHFGGRAAVLALRGRASQRAVVGGDATNSILNAVYAELTMEVRVSVCF